MSVEKMSKEDLELLSNKDITYMILEESKKSINTADLFKKIIKLLELPDSYFDTKIADYYTSLATDKRFVLLNDGTWDLKKRYKSDEIKKHTEEDEDDEYDFLAYLGKVKNEQEFEMKSFVLALYYRSKKDFNQARHYYDVYLTSKHVNNDIGVIMDSVWNGKAKSELVAESVKKFENPVLRKLFAENHIL